MHFPRLLNEFHYIKKAHPILFWTDSKHKYTANNDVNEMTAVYWVISSQKPTEIIRPYISRPSSVRTGKSHPAFNAKRVVSISTVKDEQ